MNHQNTPNPSILIYGSSRSDGNTRKAIDELIKFVDHPEIIDLNNYDIGYFDYGNEKADDDFIPLIKEILTFERIIFVTPVYWYAMSAQLKTFFDRFSDLLKFEKDLGRKLRGKSMLSISSSQNADLPEGFDMPFRETALYLGMKYLGHCHCPLDKDDLLSIDNLEKLSAIWVNPNKPRLT